MAAPVAPSTGDYITKRVWDAEITDRWDRILDPWTPYTPTWGGTTTNPVLGNGSLVAAYKLADPVSKTAYIRLRLVAGSTTTFGSGFWTFSLPDDGAPSVLQTIHGFAGRGDGSSRYPIAAQMHPTGGIERIAVDGSTGVTNTVPFAWATNDQLVLGGVYQIS